MRKPLALLAFLLFAALPSRAQTQVQPTPDCIIGMDFNGSAATRSNIFQNVQGCTTWHLEYYSTGYSALSVEIDEASDSNGQPGSWSAFPSVSSGTQPLTATSQGQITAYKYYPWVSININSVTQGAATNHLVLRALGWRPGPTNDSNSAPGSGGAAGSNACASATGSAVPASGCYEALNNGGNLIGRIGDSSGRAIEVGAAAIGAAVAGNPVLAGTKDTAGNAEYLLTAVNGTVALGHSVAPSTLNVNTVASVNTDAGTQIPLAVSTVGQDPCLSSGNPKSTAFANITTATTTQLVALSAGKVIYVCEVDLDIASTTASTVLLEYGTAGTCATGPTSVTPTYTNSTLVDAYKALGNGGATLFATAVSNGLCAVTTVGTTPTIGVHVTYILQ